MTEAELAAIEARLDLNNPRVICNRECREEIIPDLTKEIRRSKERWCPDNCVVG
jgi:hypothetical protein